MRQAIFLHFFLGTLACLSAFWVNAEDAYRYYTWTVTYGTISPLGVPQQVGFSTPKTKRLSLLHMIANSYLNLSLLCIIL